ncbi:biotin/lipoyl-binding protein [Mangrovibacter sp. SLW1]
MQWPVNFKQTLLNNAGKISVLLLLATMLCAIGYLLPLRTEVFRPTREVLHQSFRGAGEMAALNQAQLSSKTPLRLQSLLVDTGDKVKRGERLAQFDDQELQADEQAAKAALDGAISSEAAAHINWLRQQHVEQQAKDDDRRAQILSRTGKGAISQSDLENTKTSLQTAQLDLASAQYQWQQAQHARTEAQAQWHAAQSRLADAHMEAPFSGLITDRKCSTGDIISPEQPVLS